jgi:hypothetical protein
MLLKAIRLKFPARQSLFGILMLATACASQAQAPRTANPNRYIYVTGETLSEQCYRDLGPINVTEPFAQATVEAGDSTMADRLRALALQKYPNDADAVIGVNVNDNDAGTATTVSGEVVQVEDRTTAACVVRDMPPVVDGIAQSAAGGMLGTLAGGLVTGSPQTAATGGYLGAATAGSIALIKNREQAQERTENTQDALAQQQQTIVSLQNERAQLNECKEEETPLAQCGSVQATATHAAPDTSDEPDWNSSQFDLEKQIEIQQDYIAKLQAQIGDLKHEMQNP